MNELASTLVDNRSILMPVNEAFTSLVKDRNSRDKFDDAFLLELRDMCKTLAAANPENIEFIQPGPITPSSYSRREPHVLNHQVTIVLKLRHLDHCLFMVVHKSLTEDPEAQLIGHIGPYTGND